MVLLALLGCEKKNGNNLQNQSAGAFSGVWRATSVTFDYVSPPSTVPCNDYTDTIDHSTRAFTVQPVEIKCTGGLTLSNDDQELQIVGGSLYDGGIKIGTISSTEIHIYIPQSNYSVDVTPEGNGFHYRENIGGNWIINAHLER